jgi:capsular exopolysaccharide synthesis family protein
MLHAEAERDISYTYTQTTPVDVSFLRKQRVIGGIQDRRIVDAYKVLRTRVWQRMQQNNWRTLGITSAGENDGKTLTAVNLGISLAMKFDHTVLLVDADMRRPNIHNLFGFQPTIGLRDYLESDTSIEDILVHPSIDRLVILPGRGSGEGSSELLASPRMLELVEELKSRYPSRIVLFDLPPVLVGDDVVAFAPSLDTAMLVVQDNKTQTDELARAIDLLDSVEIIGTVLNKSTEDNGQGYDYYY